MHVCLYFRNVIEHFYIEWVDGCEGGNREIEVFTFLCKFEYTLVNYLANLNTRSAERNNGHEKETLITVINSCRTGPKCLRMY